MKWYVISGENEHTCCDFISVNVLKHTLWLNINGKTFKVLFDNKKGYEYAKRGEITRCTASTKSVSRRIKIVFK